VDAELAYACIQSVPINATVAKELVNSLKPYISFQSTLKTLETPPTEYSTKVQSPVHILKGLDDIIAKVDGGEFKGEYDVSE
jgi:hypothetical protein